MKPFKRKEANEPKNIMWVNLSDFRLERDEDRKYFIDSDELAKDWEYMIDGVEYGFDNFDLDTRVFVKNGVLRIKLLGDRGENLINFYNSIIKTMQNIWH